MCIAFLMAFTTKQQKVFLVKNSSQNLCVLTCNKINTFNDSNKCDSLFNYAKQYIGKPYCYGSKPPKCFDCSGFVNHCFSKFGISLPRSSGQIAYKGKFVSLKNAHKGDLIFFTGRNSQSENVGHVGIVEKCENDKIYFIHASVQAGVIVSNTQEDYYAKRLLFVKRVRI